MSANSNNFFVKIINNHWLRVLLEVIAFILLVTKLIPTEYVTNGWLFLILLGITIIGLLITNYKNTQLLLAQEKTIIEKEKLLQDEKNKIEKKINKSNLYAEALPLLNNAFQQLHYALRKNNSDKTVYHEPFMVFCQNLERVFTKITERECHVCIKIAIYPQSQIPAPSKINKIIKDLKVKTYCRSSSTQANRLKVDQSNSNHFINENTDFEEIYKGAEYFYSPDLAEIENYKNSSFKINGNQSSTFFPSGTPIETRKKIWPLNYRTTIIAPITPAIKETNQDQIILGLLCVDCKEPYAFNETNDIHIVKGCADGIYNSFKNLFN